MSLSSDRLSPVYADDEVQDMRWLGEPHEQPVPEGMIVEEEEELETTSNVSEEEKAIELVVRHHDLFRRNMASTSLS